MDHRSQRQRLTLTVSNDLADIARVTEEFNAYASANGLSEATRRRLNVALDELLNNAISYGYADGGAHTINLTLTLAAPRLVVTLEDDGVPFNPFDRPAPDTAQPLADRDVGGLGLHIVRNLMDDVHYERRGNTNIITLTKDLSDGAA